ncbi:MAG: DNA-processing protein DprA [Burkholderiales bacterium]|nr:DNA-processing protein DprA [Burkholderiales bacterium]
MERDDLAAWLRLQLTPGVGNVGARRLLTAFGLPQAIFTQPASVLAQVVSSTQAQALQEAPPDWADLLETTWAWLQAAPAEHRVLAIGDAAYPASLLNIEDPPLLLYAKGAARLWESNALAASSARSLAVVGSRNPTPQGIGNARQFAHTLAQAGLTIVSGMALGIDGAAHEGALEGAAADQLATIAVVGTGLDRVYPRQHHDLAHRIAQHGLLLSEYPLGTAPLAANFPKRNRIISGLAHATLVVEAALQSGSLITARLSTEQGKDVFAIPGSIHATQARGCHALIKQGAKLVESAQDILEEFGALDPAKATASDTTNADSDTAGLSRDALQLLDALGFDPTGLDALQARTGLDTAALQVELMQLELQGVLARLPGGLFQRLARC